MVKTALPPAASALPLKSRLAERVRDALRVEILQGQRRGQLPPERRLAEEFEVSRPTMHMALNALRTEGLVEMSPRHQSRVAKRTHAVHAGLPRRAEVMVLCYKRFKPELPDLNLVTDPLRHSLHRLGYDLKIMDPFARGLKNIDNLLTAFDAEHRPAFYVLLSVPPAAHRWFVAHKMPAIVSGSREPDVPLPAVDMENEVMMRHATQYLLRRGHRRIAFFSAPAVAVGTTVMQRTFRQTCAAWSTGNTEVQVITRPVDRAEVIGAVQHVFAGSRRPTAVIATEAEQVFGLYSTLATLGLRIPRDVSVLALWHTPYLDFLHPLPTSYRVSWDRWANRIACVIRNYIRLGVLPHTFTKVMPTLREGESVATIHPV